MQITPSTATLPDTMAKIYRHISKPQDAWLTKLVTINPAKVKECENCKNHRQLFVDLTVCVSAREEALCLRYEPCKDCHPYHCYHARMANAGMPSMDPVCIVEEDRRPVIDWRGPHWARHSNVWRKTGKRGSMHAWVTRHADSRFSRWYDVEAMEDAGYNQHKRQMSFAPDLLLDIDGARGEGLTQFLEHRLKSPAAHNTWVIGGSAALDQIIPEGFLRI